jgi:hypothetical protein
VRPGYGQPGGPEPVWKKGAGLIKSATLLETEAPVHPPI